MAIVLASASPRRQELLRQIGCQFRVVVSDFAEDNSASMPPEELAVYQARMKACAVAAEVSPGDVVIGADTIVVHQGRVFGKPEDEPEAIRMLLELSGEVHQVISGVAVVKDNNVFSGHAVTDVTMRSLTHQEIEHYVATGEPMDKAGAYAIQGMGALLVEKITGCYSNVVGLPLITVAGLLQKTGVVLL